LSGVEGQIVPPSLELQEYARAAGQVATTAVEEIMRTDPAAAFEYPAGHGGTRGVTYSAPTGDD